MIDEVQRYVQTGQDDLANQDITPGADTVPAVEPPQPQPQSQAAPEQQPQQVTPQPAADPLDMLRRRAAPDATNFDDIIDLLNKRLQEKDAGPPVPPPSAEPITEATRKDLAGKTETVPEGTALEPLKMLDPKTGRTVQPEPERTTLERTWRRLFGTDVDDPLMWTRTGTELVGGLGGTIAGSQIPGPPIVKGVGAIAGGFIGTVTGAVAPEATLAALAAMGVISEDTQKKMGLSASELYQVVEGEALLDIYTMGGVSAMRMTGRGMTSLFTGATRQSKAMAEAGLREGIALMPVQVGEGRFARGFVSVMGHLPFIAGPLRRGGTDAVERIGRMYEGIPQRLGPLSTFDEASGQILRESRQTAEAISSHFYQETQNMFATAGRQQLVVRPVTTDTVTKAVISEIERITPAVADGGRFPLPKNIAATRDFLQSTTARLYDQAGNSADQSLRQMDTMITSIEQQIQKAGKAGDRDSIEWLDRVRQAVQSDMVTHVLSRSGNANGSQMARQFIADFAELDRRQSETIAELFGNATMQRVGAKISPNQRAAMFLDDRVGHTENLAKVLMDSGNTQMVQELSRVVSPDAMRRLSNAVFNRAVSEAQQVTDTAVRFDVNKFAERLGLDAPTSGRYQQTAELLRRSGGMTAENLQEFVNIARHIDGVELPNVSRFIARRATFGGLGTVLRSYAVGSVLLGGGGAAGHAATSNYQGGVFGVMVTYGGLRLVSSMISNPTSARALTQAFAEEGSYIARRAAWYRAAVGATGDMMRQGYNSNQVQTMLKNIRGGLDEFDSMVKEERKKR